MVLNDMSQTFLFTFRTNGEAHGLSLAEVQVQQLSDNDASVADDAYRRNWYGTEQSLTPMLADLGFPLHEVEGVLAALRSHRGADRKLSVTPDQLLSAGFTPAA